MEVSAYNNYNPGKTVQNLRDKKLWGGGGQDKPEGFCVTAWIIEHKKRKVRLTCSLSEREDLLNWLLAFRQD